MHQTIYTWANVREMAFIVCDQIRKEFTDNLVKVYPIPKAGLFAGLLVKSEMASHSSLLKPRVELVECPDDADCYVDDIIDSGNTRLRTFRNHGNKPFYALMDKQTARVKEWVSFPWDRTENEDGPHDNIRRILQYIGEDPERPGLKETPDRVVRSYAELYAGYKQNPADVFKTFENGCDEIVLLKNIQFTSTCEHHLLPFIGTASIAYVPQDGKVIGLSKLARLLEIFARRLQIQEKLTTDVTTALNEHLKPLGSACIIKASHLCVACRGVQKQHSEMVTSSLTGVFREDQRARSELLQLIQL